MPSSPVDAFSDCKATREGSTEKRRVRWRTGIGRMGCRPKWDGREADGGEGEELDIISRVSRKISRGSQRGNGRKRSARSSRRVRRKRSMRQTKNGQHRNKEKGGAQRGTGRAAEGS